MSLVVRGAEIHGAWPAVGGTLLLSWSAFLVALPAGDSGRVETVHVRRVVRL